jgi:hypothetical protein
VGGYFLWKPRTSPVSDKKADIPIGGDQSSGQKIAEEWNRKSMLT